MQIAGYLKTSLIEWEGEICSVIFTPGCVFRCPFCHNADLVDPLKTKKISLRDEEEILRDLEERKKWIDAVVITGGEPTLQSDLPEFLAKLRDLGFLRMIHTNGTKPERINELIVNGLTNYICMDLKGDFGSYQKFTGVSVEIEKIKESVGLIAGSGLKCEFRTTVVPGLHDLENLTNLAKDLRSAVYGLPATADKKAVYSSQKTVSGLKWFLQQFQPNNCFDKKYLKVEPFKKEELEFFQKELQKIIPATYLRGL